VEGVLLPIYKYETSEGLLKETIDREAASETREEQERA
jgi:hypothetical protein